MNMTKTLVILLTLEANGLYDEVLVKVQEAVEATEVKETEKTRVEEVLVELGNIREGLDRVSAKIELEDYETQEEIDADVANVNLFIESLTELQEEFTDTEVVEGKYTYSCK